VKLCVEYATRPSRSRLPPSPARRVGRSPAVAAPLGLVPNPKPSPGPPAPKGEATDHDLDSCIDQPPNCQRGRGPPRDEPGAVRPWRLARGRGRPAGRRPRPAPRRRRRRNRPPARLRRRAGAMIRSIVGPRHSDGDPKRREDREADARGRGATLTAAWSRCKGRVRIPLSSLHKPSGGAGVRASPRDPRRRRRAVGRRRRRPGGNPRLVTTPAWFSKYP
jgi:hypothetical protein